MMFGNIQQESSYNLCTADVTANIRMFINLKQFLIHLPVLPHITKEKMCPVLSLLLLLTQIPQKQGEKESLICEVISSVSEAGIDSVALYGQIQYFSVGLSSQVGNTTTWFSDMFEGFLIHPALQVGKLLRSVCETRAEVWSDQNNSVHFYLYRSYSKCI